jgi:peroxiredoxin
MKSKWILVTAACLGLGLASVPFWPSTSGVQRVAAQGQSASPAAGGVCDVSGKAAPGFTLSDMNGASVSLADYKGKVVLLNFWATWCGPCKYEIPTFVKLQDKYRDRGVVFLGLSVDDPLEQLKPFAQKYSINYPLLVGLGHEDVQDAYGPIYGIPITVMIDRQGNICRTHTGLASEAELEKQISALL